MSMLILLDLSAEFDTIDYSTLYNILEFDFGIIGSARNLFISYITGRTQRVQVNGHLSDDFLLHQGAPQGSCVGPILFLLFRLVEKHSMNIMG